MDIEKLSKLLGMTTSPNDHEALSAMRKANAMLATAKLTWNGFLRPRAMAQARQETPDWMTRAHGDNSCSDPEVLVPMFDHLMTRLKDSGFRNYVESVHNQFEISGSISKKQFDVLWSSCQKTGMRR